MQVAVIDAWRDHDPVFSWGDHTTPLRLKRLVRVFAGLFDQVDSQVRERLARMIAEHSDRLLHDAALVRSHHNHALDQVYSLALAKRHMPFLPIPEAELVRRLAIERKHLLSSESVVVENSPGYQSWIPARIAECQRLLHGEPDATMLAQAQAFIDWIARPDGTYPDIGDTAPGKPASITSRPLGTCAFPHAGYVVHRSKEVHCVVKCGFLSHAHRHADDGALQLHAFGQDWIVEAGMFGYAPGWEREFARSPEAHSLSYRVGANVIRSTTSRRYQRHRSRWGMTATGNEATCRSFMFDDAVYTRRLRFGDVIEIEDSFDVPGTIRTRFHVPSDKTIAIEDGRVTIGGRVAIEHALPAPSILAGHRTDGYLSYAPAQVIEFDWPEGVIDCRFTVRF
jgi:Heparinase II/III-like protein.